MLYVIRLYKDSTKVLLFSELCKYILIICQKAHECLQIILYLFHTLTIPLCYPLPAGLTAPFTYTIPYFSKKRNSFHSHLTIFNIFLFLHAVFPNQKLVCYILFIVGQWGTAGTAGTALFSFSSPYVRGRVIVFCWTCWSIIYFLIVLSMH